MPSVDGPPATMVAADEDTGNVGLFQHTAAPRTSRRAPGASGRETARLVAAAPAGARRRRDRPWASLSAM